MMKSHRFAWPLTAATLSMVVSALVQAAPPMEWIRVATDGVSFARDETGQKFVAWGFNYDHDADGRLLEDYWANEWPTVEADFREMRELGANVVRIHLQFARFMDSPDQPSLASLNRLAELVQLAERSGLYLDLTGLGCYHQQDVPPWYGALSESARWEAQAQFWEAVAKTCANSPAIFCYDLMNEPILPGAKPESEWLTGELGGKHFVQRISLDLAGRSREQVAKAWVDKQITAIRKHDRRHLITVGVIPWAMVFPGAKPLFNGPDVGQNLDFVSVHFYPEKDQIEKALTALAVYNVGKPLVIEEMFPLKCGTEQLDEFITRSRPMADGWIGFYWGKTIEDYERGNGGIAEAITRGWLEYFRKKTPVMLTTE
jgi:hypothetical protein